MPQTVVSSAFGSVVLADASGVRQNPGAATIDYARSLFKERYHNRLNARYDAAQTTAENEVHWSMADSMSAAAATNVAVREKLRQRSRYEVENNCYAAAAVRVTANATFGGGPRVRFFLGDPAANQAVRAKFAAWMKRIQLAQKLRMLREAYDRDGAGLLVRFTNRRLPASMVQLDYALVDADRLRTPYSINPYGQAERNYDGILVDENELPIRYQILDEHPGSVHPYTQGDFGKFRTYRAEDVIHYTYLTRAGQFHGVPTITPALPLFAQWRRFVLATLTAAETAASIAAMLQLDTTVLASHLGDVPALAPEDMFDLPRGGIPALPPGYTLSQLKAEHPQTTLEIFERVMLKQIGRALVMPYNVIAGDSSNYNMASGNMDYRAWWEKIDVDRMEAEQGVITPIVEAWWSEARRIFRYLPGEAARFDLPPHKVTWPTRFEHNDPAKVAAALAAKHSLGLLTDDDYFDSIGEEPEEHYQELEEQIVRRKRLGLASVGATPPAPAERESDPEEARR